MKGVQILHKAALRTLDFVVTKNHRIYAIEFIDRDRLCTNKTEAKNLSSRAYRVNVGGLYLPQVVVEFILRRTRTDETLLLASKANH